MKSSLTKACTLPRVPLSRSVATVFATLSIILASSLGPTRVMAQTTKAQRADSARAASDSARRIEQVLVRAIRASDAAPIAQKTINRAAIAERNFGQDVPLLLQGASPSITAHTETGTTSGYSYLRLRGMDQTRINITIDGVPLNDPEDQVLYFANFADLMANVQSVQVQRGVGTSTAGTASYAGSLNFETTPIARADAGGDVELQFGAYNARRVSASFRSGLINGFAVFGRASALQTDGYRDHSGVEGRSAFVGAGWFGKQDIVKLTVLVGLLADTLSYVGATPTELRANRRFNPLAPDELDKFGQQMVALSYSRIIDEATTWSTTAYRNSASGNYDYFDGGDRYRYGLAHSWYGVTSAVNHEQGNLQLNIGVNANTYERAHRAWLRPDLVNTLYDNTGHKQDVSGFVKASYDQGPLRWFADVQARHATFRYVPDVNAEISERSIDWTFLNPKVGVTAKLADGVTAFASYGRTTREPARSDLLAGDDDLNASNVADYGDFARVKPESVNDAEVGLTLTRRRYELSANVYSMDFTNDIERIGAPTASGSVLRRNVGSSYRRGLELDGTWRATRRITLSGNAALSTNRIRSFTDSSRGTPVVRTNVEPLLTPRFVTTQRAEVAATRRLALSLEGRYQSRAYLDNTSSADRVLPSFYVIDASARFTIRRYSLMVRGVNLGDNQNYGSGSVSGSSKVRYFVLPARSVNVTASVQF